MVSTTKSASFSVLAAACFVGQCQPYTPRISPSAHRQKYVLAAASSTPSIVHAATERHFTLRRSFLTYSFAATFGIAASFVRPDAAIAADGKLNAILGQIKQGRDQLECVPDLIEAEKWDASKYIT
jgi:hypothetical protein